MTFAWDSISGEEGDTTEFVKNGFKLESSVVLSTKEITVPPKYNEQVERKVDLETDHQLA